MLTSVKLCGAAAGAATLLFLYAAPPVTASETRGIQCTPYGSTKPQGPFSYRVSDIGKPGVPKLAAEERTTISRITHYVHSKTLRFAFVRGSMIVFDARLGPCLDAAPGYRVLNGACNEYYEPGERPTATFGIPGCGPPLPWQT